MIFVRYSERSKGYILYYPLMKKIVISRNVKFDDNVTLKIMRAVNQ